MSKRLAAHKKKKQARVLSVVESNDSMQALQHLCDLVTDGELSKDIRGDLEAWAACIAGALEKQDYLNTIKRAGFRNVTTVSEHSFSHPAMDESATGRIISLQVRANK